MQNVLRSNLLNCASAFAEARRIKLSTLGRLAANDGPFFHRLRDTSKTFTAKKYDEVVAWFDVNWPAEAAWPVTVARPSEPHSRSDDNTAGRTGGSSQHPIDDIQIKPAPDRDVDGRDDSTVSAAR